MIALVRRIAQACARFDDTAWADVLGVIALIVMTIAGLFIVFGFGGWGALG